MRIFMAMAVMALPLASAQAVTPIHAYEFDGNVNDSAGSANGTLLGGAVVQDGRLVLNGTSAYVQFDTKLVPTTGPYSVLIRVAGNPNPGLFTEIISQGASGGTGFYIGTAPGRIIRLTDNVGNTNVVFPTVEADLLYSNSAAGSRLYINGVLAFSSTLVGAGGPGGTNTRFGRQFAPFDEFFAGSIDFIRIYDSAIAPADLIAPAPAVPEPASWGMMIAGFGLTGAALRRRRHSAAKPSPSAA